MSGEENIPCGNIPWNYLDNVVAHMCKLYWVRACKWGSVRFCLIPSHLFK